MTANERHPHTQEDSMARTAFRILTTTCRRCGKAIATGDRSLYEADAAK